MQEPFGAYTWYPVNDQPVGQGVLRRAHLGAARHGRRLQRPAGRPPHVAAGAPSRGGTSPARRASYLTTIAIGDYVRYRDRGPHGLPITYWLPRRDQRALPELRRTPEMIRWLEKHLGRYPFDRIGAVVVPSWLGDGDPDAGHHGQPADVATGPSSAPSCSTSTRTSGTATRSRRTTGRTCG